MKHNTIYYCYYVCRYLAKDLGERCVAPIKTFLQHICFKVPDRSEYRTYAAEVSVHFNMDEKVKEINIRKFREK